MYHFCSFWFFFYWNELCSSTLHLHAQSSLKQRGPGQFFLYKFITWKVIKEKTLFKKGTERGRSWKKLQCGMLRWMTSCTDFRSVWSFALKREVSWFGISKVFLFGPWLVNFLWVLVMLRWSHIEMESRRKKNLQSFWIIVVKKKRHKKTSLSDQQMADNPLVIWTHHSS